ncbi:MAG: FG-GAP repeat protein [Planctomycetes bacterium]|nr:FG-GAP repeat protein [Planctomycetota bacterium]
MSSLSPLALLALASPALAAPQGGACFIDELLPPSPAVGDEIGAAVDLYLRTAYVGAPGDDALGNDAGAAHVFGKSGYDWSLFATLYASDGEAGDRFGSAVALHGGWAFVGAPGDDDLGADAGAVWAYQRVGTAWQPAAKLTAGDGAAGAGFGGALAYDGGHLIVGARGADGAQPGAGAAYVFALQGGAWTQGAKLTGSDAQSGDLFGHSVGVSGASVVVGAPGYGFNHQRGLAYAYDLAGGAWVETRLQPDPWDPQPEYGYGVAIDGDRIVVNSFRNIDHVPTGAFFAWTRLAGAWTQTTFTEGQITPGQTFGTSIALEGDLLAVGEPGTATVWTFRATGTGPTAWTQDEGFHVGTGDGFWFGRALALYDGDLLVGAPGNAAGGVSGAAYSFLAGALCPDAYCGGTSFALCPCLNAQAFPNNGCKNSTGWGGYLYLTDGLPSVAQDSLTFAALRLPPNQFGVLFLGDVQAPAPFGDGLRCAGGAHTHRFAPQQASAVGDLVAGPGLFAAAGGLAAGDVRGFQFWYRDPTGPCGSAFNTTNALRVELVP